MKVAVTGGSGVVGRAILGHLVAKGHEVRGLARSDEAAAVVAGLGASPIRGDVLDSESLKPLVDRAERVFHVAGVNEMCSLSPANMDRVNIDGTRNVLEACRKSAVGRLIHTSSAATIGERHGAIGNEDTVHPGTHLSRYERSKCLAEELVLEHEGDPEVVVVNPSSVQGPGRDTGSTRLILDLINGRLKVLTHTEVSFVDIDDCAAGHELAAERGANGARYILNGHTVGMRDAVLMIEQILGRELGVRYAPAWLIRSAGAAAGAAARVTGKQPVICPEMARVILEGARYDGSKATKDLGLSYRPLEETLNRTIDWFTSKHLA